MKVFNKIKSQRKFTYIFGFMGILIVFLSIYIFVLAFVNASNYNIVDKNTNVVINTTKQIELSDYYGMTALLVSLHLDIANEVEDKNELFYVVDMLKQMRHYVDLDIIDYLSYSFDIKSSLSFVLFEISDVLDKASAVKVELKNNLQEFEQQKIECDENKDISDKNFTLALKDLDSKKMQINLKKSLSYEECSIKARIAYNVQSKIIKLLDFYYEILEKKYSYFNGNRGEIISNYKEILYDRSRK